MSIWLAVGGALLVPAAALTRAAGYRSLDDGASRAATNAELFDLAAVHHRTAWCALLLASMGVTAALVGLLLLTGPGEVVANPRLLGWAVVSVLIAGYLCWLAVQAFLPTDGLQELIVADAVPTQRRVLALVESARTYPYPVIGRTGGLAVTAWAAVHVWVVARLPVVHRFRRRPGSDPCH
ncbi:MULTISPECIES: hypothetical protein [unclassified Micromonospora]|uniref:hypothetical protein n=1 Tax=unclassified Micromonospora TaxID=2617518 RepID=UPI003A876CD4